LFIKILLRVLYFASSAANERHRKRKNTKCNVNTHTHAHIDYDKLQTNTLRTTKRIIIIRDSEKSSWS